MSRAFSTMKTNVGNNVQDTSTGTASIIGTYINKRYFQILRQINWTYINEDYTIAVVAGTQEYVLPTDLKSVFYAVDTTNGRELKEVNLQDVARYTPGKLTSQSSTYRYSIFNSDDGSKYIRLHNNPASAFSLSLPYIVKPAALSADSDTNILDIEDAIEVGATADTLRYKRKWRQAAEIEKQYLVMVDDLIWENANQPNKIVQFKPTTFNRDNLV